MTDAAAFQWPLDSHERLLATNGFWPIAGLDEAGRGPCAGPLVAAAVVLAKPLEGLADSKKLTPRTRERLYESITTEALDVSVTVISARECDQWGLQHANLTALRRALAQLKCDPAYGLVDGFALDGAGVPTLGVIKGDQIVASIAAASIIAKVTRDRIMVDLDKDFPGYGFAQHKGYSTRAHMEALRSLGPTKHHRLSYANVKAILEVQ